MSQDAATTLVALCVDPQSSKALLLSVGDSNAYFVDKEGRKTAVFMPQVNEQGALTNSIRGIDRIREGVDIRKEPGGAASRRKVQLYPFMLEPGQIILLGSDGYEKGVKANRERAAAEGWEYTEPDFRNADPRTIAELALESAIAQHRRPAQPLLRDDATIVSIACVARGAGTR